MKALFLQVAMPYVKTKIENLSENLATTFDFAIFEQELMLLMNEISAIIVAIELTEMLTSPEYLAQLKQLGSRLGMRFKEYRTVTIYLATGQRLQIPTPYFIKASPKRGRKKQGPNGRGAHLGLDVLGFRGRGSSHLVSEVVKMAVLCLSLAIAEQMLAGRGVLIDKDTIHRFCRELAEGGWRSVGLFL